MANSADALADALLDAQVAFLAAQLGPAGVAQLLEAEIDAGLEAASTLTLGSVVSAEQITAVATKYVVAMQIPGSIPELASEIAARLYEHPAQEAHRLEEVIAGRHVRAFTAKLLALPLVQERLLESPLVVEVLAELLYRAASEAAAQNRELAGRIPGLSTLLGAGGQLLGSVAPEAGRELDVRLQELATQAARMLLRRAKGGVQNPEDRWIEETVLSVWEQQADRPVSALRNAVTQEDLEDLIVLGYDFWLAFRETAYLHALLAEGVAFVFDRYGEMTLLGLLEEFGVSRADLIEEAHRFAPPILTLLAENGMLEAFLRRRLAPFFAAPQTRALLTS